MGGTCHKSNVVDLARKSAIEYHAQNTRIQSSVENVHHERHDSDGDPASPGCYRRAMSHLVIGPVERTNGEQ
jgi:hypothetical protein